MPGQLHTLGLHHVSAVRQGAGHGPGSATRLLQGRQARRASVRPRLA